MIDSLVKLRVVTQTGTDLAGGNGKLVVREGVKSAFLLSLSPLPASTIAAVSSVAGQKSLQGTGQNTALKCQKLKRFRVDLRNMQHFL